MRLTTNTCVSISVTEGHFKFVGYLRSSNKITGTRRHFLSCQNIVASCAQLECSSQNIFTDVRFQVLTAASMKMAVFSELLRRVVW
jgi:hypothetical protein